MKDVSIVVPVYNEAERLRKNVPKIIKEIEKITKNYEVIIAEDGSTDGTDKVAEQLAKEFKNVIHQHYREKLGRGKALKKALEKSKGEIFIYMDVDLASVFIKHLPAMLSMLKKKDVVVGSRYAKGSLAKRSLLRLILSKVYNFLQRFLLGVKVDDAVRVAAHINNFAVPA